MNIEWEHIEESSATAEMYKCEIGKVEHTLDGWKAYVYVREDNGSKLKTHLVGDSYRTSASAKSAVIKKHGQRLLFSTFFGSKGKSKNA